MNKWIFAGALGGVFLATLGFSYGPGYGGSLLAFLDGSANISPEMSPRDMVTPVVTQKKMVTFQNVTNVTSVSPIMSPSIYIDSQYLSVPLKPTRILTVSPTTLTNSSVSPSLKTVSPTQMTLSPTPQPVIALSSTVTATPTPTASQLAKININIADLNELDKISGVGPVIAKNIIDYRTVNGPFRVIEDIIKVKGIGDKTFQKMKDQITIGP